MFFQPYLRGLLWGWGLVVPFSLPDALTSCWELRDQPEASNHGCLFVLQAVTFITSSQPHPPNSLNPPFFFPFLGWSKRFTLRGPILSFLCVTNSLPSPSAPGKEEGACLPD